MRRIAIFSFAILSLFAGGGWARTWIVNIEGTGEAPNIQAAIDSCAAGDTILVELGTYKGTGNRDIDFTGKMIVLASSSGAAATIIDCEGSSSEYHRGFYFHSGEDTTSVLQGFTITSGHTGGSGGAICCIGASPKILDNVITGNYANGGGGGIYCEGTHSIISGNTLSSNEVAVWLAEARNAEAPALSPSRSGAATAFSPPSGGNILCVADSSLVQLNTITGGRGTLGSAILCSDSHMRVRNNNISANGGVYTEDTVCFLSGSYDIEGNTITSNRTWHDGAGLYCSDGVFRIVGNAIRNNAGHEEASGTGGGVFCGPGSYTIENNDIVGNWNNGAGGIYIEGSGIVSNNRIMDNEASHAGACAGCLAASFGSSLDVGGGILIDGAASLAVVGNTITGNFASWGGGIACLGSNPEIRGNIIAHNEAHHNGCSSNGDQDGVGGGLYCDGSSPLVMGNTIYANSASNESATWQGGAAIHCESASGPTIQQNIIAKNQTSNVLGVGGIFCEDSASVPVISCCDVYANSNANYGGTLGDQTGLSGNFSLDPLFCGAEYEDFWLHILSPCSPGNHPNGEDCGLIGARAAACDNVATLLAGYETSVDASAVTIRWTLAEAGENVRSSILRAEGHDGTYREIASAGISREGLKFNFKDTDCEPGMSYRYRVDVQDDEGTRVLFETSEISMPPLPLSLDQNFPNPFNPSTAISYYLPSDSKVTLAIYDASGRRVARLVDRIEKKGRHAIVWDGKNETGSSLGSGLYFYRLVAGKETISRKMILLR